jgi:hypothetical protein
MSQQVIDILLRIDARTAALTSMQRNVSQLERTFASLGRVAGTIAGVNLSLQAGVSIVRSLTSQAFDLQEKFGNLAERFSTTSEAIQVADYIARRFGQTVDDLAGFSDRLQAKLAEARTEGGKAAKAFGDMGLSIEALERLSWERRLQAFGTALIAGEGSAKVYSGAVEIAGVNSQKLFDTLRGSAAFDEFAEKGKRAGQVMEKEFSDRISRASQGIEDLKRRSSNFFGNVAADLLNIFDVAGGSGREKQLEWLIKLEEDRHQRSQDEGFKLWDPGRLERLRAELAEMRRATAAAVPGPAAGEASPAAAAAAAVATPEQIREEQARIWLASEEARKTRERVQAAQEGLATDQQRLETLQIRLRVLDQERVIALQAAGSQAEREQVALQYTEKMLAVMKDVDAAEKAIASTAKQDETERRKLLELEVQRRRTVIDRLQFERDQLAQREDLSEVEKQRAIKVLVEAQRAVVADILRLKREALATATDGEKVQLEADIQGLEQEDKTLGRGVDPQATTWEKQIGLADTLREGIDGVSRSLADAAVRGGDLRESLSNVFQSIAADLAAATIRAIIFKSIIGASGGAGQGLAGFLGLGQMGFASGGYTGPGPRFKVAGVVHAGEGVIDKPTLDRHGGAPFFRNLLAGLRSAPGYAAGGYVAEMASGAAAAGAAGGVGGESIAIHNHFSDGLTPAHLARMLPDMERRQRRGVLDAQRRKKDGHR